MLSLTTTVMPMVTRKDHFIKRKGVYAIRCLINNKRYIGSTGRSFISRWAQHIKDLKSGQHYNKGLQDEWLEHGEYQFVFEILKLTESGEETENEQLAIDYFQSYQKERGYNVSPTAGSNRGVKMSAEMCEALSVRVRERNFSPESRRKMSESKKNYFKSPEARAAASERMKKQWESPEFRAAHSERMKSQLTPEQRALLSERAKKTFEKPGAREAQSKRCKNLFGTPEGRAAQSERTKKHFSSEEARAAHRLRMKKVADSETPEARAMRTAKSKTTKILRRASRLLVVIQPEQCSCCFSTIDGGSN